MGTMMNWIKIWDLSLNRVDKHKVQRWIGIWFKDLVIHSSLIIYDKTQCLDEFRSLSGSVTEILTACRMLQILIAWCQIEAEIHTFPTMYIYGGVNMVKIGEKHEFVQISGLKTPISVARNFEHLTSKGCVAQNFEILSSLTASLQNLDIDRPN